MELKPDLGIDNNFVSPEEAVNNIEDEEDREVDHEPSTSPAEKKKKQKKILKRLVTVCDSYLCHKLTYFIEDIEDKSKTLF